jgi:hypothetical protein
MIKKYDWSVQNDWRVKTLTVLFFGKCRESLLHPEMLDAVAALEETIDKLGYKYSL